MKFSPDKYKILETVKRIRRGENMTFYYVTKTGDEEELINKKLRSILQKAELMYFVDSISSKIEGKEYKFMNKLKPFLDRNISGTGIILWNTKLQIAFDFRGTDSGNLAFDAFFIKDGDVVFGINTGYTDDDKMTHIQYYEYHECTKISFPGIEKLPYVPFHVALLFQIFKKYAPIETIVINRKKKQRGKINGEKHVNKSDLDVTVIDSNWFRNIIRSDGFNVKGHFRLQPCGVGRKEKKLIWINEFEKTGYSMKAKKEDSQ